MEQPSLRKRSELPSGDPTLLNRLAWSRRWTDRNASMNFAETARATAAKGTGKRSRVQHGLALTTLAWHAKWRGALDQAMEYCLSAETYLPERENAECRALVYSLLGSIHFARNRFDLAECALERGFWLLRDIPEMDVQDAIVELLLARAIVQRHTGERARAGITLGRASDICTEEMFPSVEYCTAIWLLADGDAEGARIRGVTALETARTQSNHTVLPYMYSLLGACDIRLGRPDDAEASLTEGLRLAEMDGDDRVRCFILRDLGLLEISRGSLDNARAHFDAASKLAAKLGLSFERKRIALQLADLFEELRDYKRAVQQHKLAWRLQNETRLS